MLEPLIYFFFAIKVITFLINLDFLRAMQFHIDPVGLTQLDLPSWLIQQKEISKIFSRSNYLVSIAACAAAIALRRKSPGVPVYLPAMIAASADPTFDHTVSMNTNEGIG